MKQIRITLDDSEMIKLKKTKGNLSWHDFIIKAAKAYGGKQ